jgi:predicted DNA-binding transcriptional regulator YafY
MRRAKAREMMRADRLLSVLMLLQRHGRMTAGDLAAELAVSERTVYRDCDALAAAGIPIFAQPGPGGGISLVEAFRTDLTGLTTREAQALASLRIPTPIVELGVGGDLQSALRKLAAAVPDGHRPYNDTIQKSFLIDDFEWSASSDARPYFADVRQALWEERQLDITYFAEMGRHAGVITNTVTPLGLVASYGAWYLVAGKGEHVIVIPLSRLQKAQMSHQRSERPADFELADFWLTWTDLTKRQRPTFNVKAIVAAHLMPYIEGFVQERENSGLGNESLQLVTLEFATFEDARMQVLSWGGAIEIISPEALRLSVIDSAHQVLQLYESSK